MKKLIISTAVAAGIAGLSICLGTAWGQATPASGTSTQAAPHKVGLIDMAHIFKNYKKFEALREELKAEIEQSDEKAKALAAQMQNLEKQMQQFASGTTDYENRERQLLKMKAEFDAFRTGAQRDFMRKESQIYKTVYLEVSDAVQKYASYYKYTLVLRFDRNSVDTAADPQDLLQRMNRQVIYHREEDDITPYVLEFLNKSYQNASSGGGGAAPRTTNRPAAAPQR